MKYGVRGGVGAETKLRSLKPNSPNPKQTMGRSPKIPTWPDALDRHPDAPAGAPAQPCTPRRASPPPSQTLAWSSGLKLNRIEVEGLGGLVGSGFSFFFQVGGRSFECLPKSAPNSAVSTENTDAEACHTAAPHCI